MTTPRFRIAFSSLLIAVLLHQGAARADDTSPASNPARLAAAACWKDLKAALSKRDLGAFVAHASPRYRRTAGENAYTFFQFAGLRKFVWGVASIKYKGNHAALLVESTSNDQKWTAGILLDRIGGEWKMDGLVDMPSTAEAYVEGGKPLSEDIPYPPGHPKALQAELDMAFNALRNSLFWQDKKMFMSIVSQEWWKQYVNSAPAFWKTFMENPLLFTNARSNVQGVRGAVVVDVMQGGIAADSIGLLFVLTNKGFRADGVTTDEKQTVAYLRGGK